MHPFTIHWSYNYPFYPGVPQIGTTIVRAESQDKALQQFRNIGYSGVSLGGKGYYKVEKIEAGTLINYKV